MTQNLTEEQKILWSIITQLIQFHSSFHPEFKAIVPDDPIAKYFPMTQQEIRVLSNENANRWSMVLWDTMENVNEIFQKNYKYDFLVREECSLFETVGDYWKYMNHLFKN